MSLDIYNLLEKISFTRVSGSTEEFKCANMLKETVESFSGNASIWPFEVSGYKINSAKLFANGKKYEVSGIKGSGNASVTAPLYYMETALDTDKYELKGKIVLINGVVNVPIYKKLLKYGAVGFISYSGDITDTPEDSDLENKELRDVLRNKGIIPGVHMRTTTAIELLKDNPKEITLELSQDEFKLTSHNVISEIKGYMYPDEVICITAHFDSVEFSKGAYDNGAGSVLIMKLYEFFIKNAPKRTLRFIWCGSEERGLLGSKAYVASLSEEDLQKIIFNINVDVAGTIIGTEYANIMAENALVDYVEYVSNEISFPIVVRQDIYSSDSIPFSDKGVPAINLMRFGRPGAAHIHDRHDTMSFISRESLEKTYMFLEFLSNKLINANTFPVKREIPENIKKKIDEYLFKNEK